MTGSNAESTSAMLNASLDRFTGERVSLTDLLDMLQDRAFAMLVFLFALPNALPMPPGTSTVTGLPLAFFSAQMMIGIRAPWLPRWLAKRSLRRSDWQAFVTRAVPYLQRVERVLRPRLLFMSSRLSERLLAGLCLFLAIILSLPIPGGNMPPGAAVALIAIGIVERDGLIILAGVAVAIVAIAIVAAVGVAAFFVFVFAMQNLFL